MNQGPLCRCDVFVHPRLIENPPGRASLDYRVGDYATFRRALLLTRPDEVELRDWRPGATGDLAVQLLEWFAYVADILTFYNERIADDSFLRTASQPENIQNLVRLLGYRPRPGIGARGVVAALLQRPGTLAVPRGFQIQSKPGPGQPPQTFEVEADTTVSWPSAVSADPPPDDRLLINSGVLLRGTVSGIKTGDSLLILARDWDGSDGRYALVTVDSVAAATDPRGNKNTRVTVKGAVGGVASGRAGDYRLLRSVQASPVWQYPTGSTAVVGTNSLDLSGIARAVKPGDPILIDTSAAAGTGSLRAATSRTFVAAGGTVTAASGASHPRLVASRGGTTVHRVATLGGGGFSFAPPRPVLVRVSSYAETIWYANPDGSTPDPTKPPAAPTPPIPIPHTSLGFQPAISTSFDVFRDRLVARFDWHDVGELIATPARRFDGTPGNLIGAGGDLFPAQTSATILVAGAAGLGVRATGTVASDASTLALTALPSPAVTLNAPLNALFGLLPVSRGKSVAGEILGSGDAGLAGQEFVLKKSPLTYLLSGAGSGDGSYASGLQVWVSGIQWQEVPSFFGQGPTDRVFVTSEDANQQTHVQFGDGEFGARLPSGVNNVVASYRYGSGAAAPSAGQLSVVLQPRPNLKGIANPEPVGGGADPEPGDRLRQYAPRSVLTLGRAVSADDYEAIAASAPGVARARTYWTWDDAAQRAMVTVYVGDDQHAQEAAEIALAGAADPNRPVTVKLATAVPIQVTLTLELDPAYRPDPVVTAAREALLDPDAGLFGANAVHIGTGLHRSEVFVALLRVSGVVAVHGLGVSTKDGRTFVGPRYDPGEGRFFQLADSDLRLTQESVTYAR